MTLSGSKPNLLSTARLANRAIGDDTAYNPREDDKIYVGTKLLDSIENQVIGGAKWWQEQAEDKEGIYDDMFRLVGGGAKNVATAISYIPGIKQLGQLEDWVAAQARDLSTTIAPELDPRYAGWLARFGTGVLTDKGLGVATKAAKASILSKIDDFTGLYDIGTGINKGGGNNAINQLIKTVTRDYEKRVLYNMSQISPNMRGGIFDYNAFINSPMPARMSRRKIIEEFITPPYYKESYGAVRKNVMPAFKQRYSKFLTDIGLDPDIVQLHHITALADSIPLYDGLRFNSPEWWELTAQLLDAQVRPGTTQYGGKGWSLPVVGGRGQYRTPHGVVHLFYDDKIAKTNFWSKSELAKIRTQPGYRADKAAAFAKIVNESEDIVRQAQNVFEALNPQGNFQLDDLVDFLGKLDADGLLPTKMIDGKYQVPQMKEMVEKIIAENKINPLAKMNDQQFYQWLGQFSSTTMRDFRALFGAATGQGTANIKVNIGKLMEGNLFKKIKKETKLSNVELFPLIKKTRKIEKKYKK